MEKIEFKGFKIVIEQDEHADGPDSWGDDSAFVVGWSRHFTVEREGFNKENFGYILGMKNKSADLKAEFEDSKGRALEIVKAFHVFPLDAYVHSGVALRLHGEGIQCRFDTSGYVGAVYVSKKEARTHKEAEKIARGLVETWQDYLNGNIYAFHIEDKDGDRVGDSCGGFYGDTGKEDAIKEAKNSVDDLAKELEEKEAIEAKAKEKAENIHFEAILAKNAIAKVLRKYKQGEHFPVAHVLEMLKQIEAHTGELNQPCVSDIMTSKYDL